MKKTQFTKRLTENRDHNTPTPSKYDKPVVVPRAKSWMLTTLSTATAMNNANEVRGTKIQLRE